MGKEGSHEELGDKVGGIRAQKIWILEYAVGRFLMRVIAQCDEISRFDLKVP